MVELIEATIIAMLSFSIGFGAGYVFSMGIDDSVDGDIRLKLAAFITVVWTVSVIAGITVVDYETPLQVHLIMGGIVGYLFGIDHPFQ